MDEWVSEAYLATTWLRSVCEVAIQENVYVMRYVVRCSQRC